MPGTLSAPRSGFSRKAHALRTLARVDALLGIGGDTDSGQQTQSLPSDFRDALTLPGATGVVRYGDVVVDFQKRRYADLDQDLIAVAAGEHPPIGRHWWEATKGASKDTDLALCLLWLLASSDRFLDCQIGAADADQAGELRKAAQGVLQHNAWLRDLVDLQRNSLVNKRTGSRAHIIACDPKGSHGARPDVLVINELHAIAHEEFAKNLLDNARKVPRGIVVVATNAGEVDSWQWKLRENARKSGRWAFHRLDRPAPWVQEKDLEESRMTNSPSRHKRLWYGVWSHGREGAEWEDRPEYFGEHLMVSQLPTRFELCAVALDPSKGKSKQSDMSAIVRVGLAGGLIWVKADLQRRPAEQIVTDLIDETLACRPDGVVIESNQFQDLLAPLCDHECQRRGIPPLPIHLYNHTAAADKRTRIRRLGPYFERKLIRILQDEGGELLVSQLRAFGTDQDHDDGPDALEMGIRLLNTLVDDRDRPNFGEERVIA